MMSSSQALEGVKVVEFSVGMAGPWIGRFMAHCGAEVIRIESRKVPGVVRLYVPPGSADRAVQPTQSPWFTDWEAGKLFVALDLKNSEAVELTRRLVARADIVVENQRTGAMEKLGLGYAELSAINPRLIALSSSGFGGHGPHPEYVTWGPNIEAMSGLASLSGFPERECTTTQYAYPDSLSALHGLFAILCALDHRDRTGEGQHIALAQLETTATMVGVELMEQLNNDRAPRKLGNASLRHAPHGCYPCAGEDRWCVIACCDEAQWQGFCGATGHSEWLEDARFVDLAARLAHREALDALIAGFTAERRAEDVSALLQAAGVAAGVVQTTEDQYQHDAHLAERGYFEHIPHLTKGEVVAPGIPLGLTGTPGHTTRSGAAIGEDNEHVFLDLLGLTREQYAHYVEAGAIETGE